MSEETTEKTAEVETAVETQAAEVAEKAESTEPMTIQALRDRDVKENKVLRVALDDVLQKMKDSPRKSRNRSLSITHLEDSIMRLGMDMKELNTPNPYPESYNPLNAIVAPTADGLKM